MKRIRQALENPDININEVARLVGAEPVKARVVEDGHIVTSGGVTSGLDFALTLIALALCYILARTIVTSKAGKVLVAIRATAPREIRMWNGITSRR